jgi:hypothetical protein
MSKLHDAVKKAQEQDMEDNGREERTVLPSNYGCEVLLEKTTLAKAKDSSFPSDAYLIWYELYGVSHLDLVRGSRIRIFDMYYDRFGPGVVKKIDFGYGRVNPKLWGYKQPEKKKRK